ncbi:MAG TPA: hypothetical protein VN193_01765 [Candidatus Angelobacter sp.]|jgi:hypothetical protein|nr:hypothetical protein [Candidatus Angelobacter sp.]
MDKQPENHHHAPDGDAVEPKRSPPLPRLTPLSAALLIPAVCLVVLASAWVATHAKGDRSPTAISNPQPTAVGTPSPTPWPLAWPAEDGGTVDPATAYGRLAITWPSSPPPTYTATLTASASVPPAGLTGARPGTVQRTVSLPQTTVDAVAARLGAVGPPSHTGTRMVWPDTNLDYDAATSTFTWQPNSRDGALPSVPRDNDSAASAAREWLLQRGLIEPLAPVVATQVSRGDLAAFTTWQITVPHLSGQSAVTEITMMVSQSGLFTDLVVVHPVVAGAAPYPMVTWQQAWAEVQAGRARDFESGGLDSAGRLNVDLVQLTTRQVGTATGGYVIPAYSFTDSARHVTAYWPALDPAQYTLP